MTMVTTSVKIPNDETIEALRQARSGEGLTEYANLESLKTRHSSLMSQVREASLKVREDVLQCTDEFDAADADGL